MGESPGVSVLVATYKGPFLVETLKSIAAQTFADFEVLVLDDANEASCREIVESLADERFHYIGNAVPLRPAMNHVKGIELAAGRRIAILNHDDLWTPTVLEKLSRVLDMEPTVGAAFSRARVADASGKFDEARTKEVWVAWHCTTLPDGLIPDWLAVDEVNPSIPAGPTTLIRADLLKSIPMPNVIGDSYDAWIGYQVARSGPVFHEDDVIGLWREHGDNLTQVRSAGRTAARIHFDYRLMTDARVPHSRRIAALRRLPRSLAAWAKDSIRGERKVAR